LSAGIIHNDPLNGKVPSHACVGEGSSYVFFLELVRQVPSLSTEEPEAILWLVSRLDEIFSLQLTVGAPVPQQIAVLDFLSMPCDVVVRAMGDCSVGIARRAAWRAHSLTSCQDCCRFENVATRRLYHVVVISLLLTMFYITLALR
jgi:hypothetical protein